MLKVLPIQSKTEQEDICRRCGVKYNPDLLAYSADYDGVLAGVCQFKLTKEGGILYDIEAATDYAGDTFEPLFVMGRGTLNFIDLCGVHYARYVSDSIDESLARAIGFTKNQDGVFDVDLTDFFVHPCQHHKEPNPYDTPKQ